MLSVVRKKHKIEPKPVSPAIKRVEFTKEMRKNYTLLVPQMSPIHFEFLEPALQSCGYNVEVLNQGGMEDVNTGLKYVNNDACYPSLIVIGQLMNALLSGKYDPHKIALVISQTGGGCRATNYISFIRRALEKAGYGYVPVVGLSAQYWKKYLTPVVSSCVVIAIGLSLLPVGMNSWGGGSGSESFGSWYHLLVGLVTLIVCLVSRYLLHGVYKNLNILVGLIFGYILSAIFTVAGIAPMIDFSGISKTISEIGFFSLPRLVFFTGHTPVFDLGAFFTIAIIFLVSAAETTGATTAVCKGSLDRDIKIEELQGSLAVDGFSSTISGCFGCLPLTSFSQNVGLVTMTGVINRFTILMGALILILASLFPPLGAFFNSLPQSVLGGCTVMMFGSILYEGIKMLKDCEFNDRTMIIVSLAFCVGVGLTQTDANFFSAFPQAVGDIFNGNAVAGVFVVSLLLSLILPKDKNEKVEE